MWSTAKASGLPLHKNLPPTDELPWTISFVIRKRAQIDSFNDLPEEKRPPDDLIWYGTGKEIDTWLKRVFKNKEQKEFTLEIDDSEIG